MDNREIDQKIAEVLGWKLMDDPDIGAWWKVPKGDPHCDAFESADNTPEYSTSLDAAMGAYEEFRKRGWRLIYLCDLGPSWGATLRREADGVEVIRAEMTPAMTICLAILFAAGLSDASGSTEAGTDKKEASNG